MKPIIGVASNYETGGLFSLKDFYVSSLTDAGATVLILPPTPDEGLIEDYFQLCQGFVIPGGGDLDPVYWGELPGKMTGAICPLRDSFELNLARRALLFQKPILGICRGCQVMNVAAGGSLVQDITTELCHMQPAPRNYPFHEVSLKPESYLRQIMKQDIIRINSFHHQAVARPGKSLRTSALAPDGTIEAIESVRGPFFIGVQWHPECMQDTYSRALFSALIAKSRCLAIDS